MPRAVSYPRVMLTGHRRVPDHQARFVTGELERVAVKLRDEHGTVEALCGMALGADQDWADAALSAGLRLAAYLPFVEQAHGWSPRQRSRWKGLLQAAHRQVVASTANAGAAAFHARNDAMLTDSDLVVAVWDPRVTDGGTAGVVRKARVLGRDIVIIDLEQGRTRIERAARRTPPGRVRVVEGDLLTDAAAVLVDPVNTVGVMGAGLAAQFARRWPGMVGPYRDACREGRLSPGGVWLWPAPTGQWVVCAATKAHWRDSSQLGWVVSAAQQTALMVAGLGAASVAVPALGAGLGGLPWSQVRPALVGVFELVDADVRLYRPAGA